MTTDGASTREGWFSPGYERPRNMSGGVRTCLLIADVVRGWNSRTGGSGVSDGAPNLRHGDHDDAEADPLRSIAQLNMLHSLAAKLNALDSVEAIGGAITAELRTIVEYHNCRVYLLQPDGRTLMPIAFRGEYFAEYAEETLEELVTVVGEGMTGWVAQTGHTLLTPNAQEVEFAIQIEGTDDITESMLLVPTKVGDRVNGVIVLSSLGYGKFDERDQQVVEVLAPHAAAAFENAKLLSAEREAARTSTALLELSQRLVGQHSVGHILQEAIETIPSLMPCAAVAAYVHDDETGAFHVARLHVIEPDLVRPRAEIGEMPADLAASFLVGDDEPFTVDEEVVAQVPREVWIVREPRAALVAPLRWHPDGFGGIVMVARSAGDRFDARAMQLAHGITNIASLALGTARRLSELERFHELVASLDAVFWEADAATMRFTFLGGRVNEMLGPEASRWPDQGVTWGEHVADADRAAAMAACREAIARGADRSFDYRVVGPDGRIVWMRDVVHFVRGSQGPRELRGLMVDITERKRAEQALRSSEQKYSEAFRREREATQRLRNLDEMKNTFLEAVSHDLRTPLTSILGSALTLEGRGADLASADALDLVGRIAANARKLERLLADLLDLDRLQRGIVTPQRRPTDLTALVARAVEEIDDPMGHVISTDVTPGVFSLDAAKVERIVENLISNAVRHTPAGTEIWVRAEPVDGGLSMVVEDAGPGLPDDLHDAVFEPFRQAPGSSSEHSPGVGIGLSLVRRFAELHGGRAWLQAREGGGSSFHVFLPTA
jgi:PAS domain S-box-containing protein